MSRVSIHLDETKPLEPVAILSVNGQSMSLSERELLLLQAEILWAVDHIKCAKAVYYRNLAIKYTEVKYAAQG